MVTIDFLGCYVLNNRFYKIEQLPDGDFYISYGKVGGKVEGIAWDSTHPTTVTTIKSNLNRKLKKGYTKI